MSKRIDRRALLVGGLNFKTGKSKPLEVSRTAPVDSRSESDYQVALFAFLSMNSPRPPLVQRRSTRAKRILVEEDRADEKYLTHQHYIFTRIRHFPNGGLRHSAVAVQLAREGVRAGAFDIILDAARRGFNGLRLELKAHDNELSDVQTEERRWLEKENYCAHVCWHYVEAIHILGWYCGIDMTRLRGYPSRHAFNLPKEGHDERCGCALKFDL